MANIYSQNNRGRAQAEVSPVNQALTGGGAENERFRNFLRSLGSPTPQATVANNRERHQRRMDAYVSARERLASGEPMALSGPYGNMPAPAESYDPVASGDFTRANDPSVLAQTLGDPINPPSELEGTRLTVEAMRRRLADLFGGSRGAESGPYRP